MGRRTAGVLSVLVLALLGLPGPLQAEPALAAACRTEPAPGVERLAGPDRYATAACTSSVAYPDGAVEVLVARGDVAGGLADGLAGAVLAEARSAPLLLTAPTRLPDATREEIRRLDPEAITILGGDAAVVPQVEQELAELVPTTRRISGVDRYATAAAVSDAAGACATAFVVNGLRPADSLVAAAPAARAGAGLLQVRRDDVPAVTAAALEGVREVVIVGGHGVVSAAVEARLRTLLGTGDVRRVAGATRAETAASVARAYPAPGTVHLSNQSDRHLVDAVTAGWAAARPGGGPVLYSQRDVPGQGTDRYLRLGGLDGHDVRLIGGRATLSEELVTVLQARRQEAAEGGPAPELRGLWVHLFDASLKTRAGIHRVLDAATAANLNTVIVQVARRHDAYYRSSVLPGTVDPDLEPGLDVLAELVPAARARGLAVHAWVSVLPAYHRVYDGLDLGADHVWTRHGPTSADPWTTRTRAGDPSVYLDPGVPGVQEHVATLLAELAGRYDLDAVHVDYLRYEGKDFGYHPRSLSRFRSVTGTSGTPAPDDAAWSAWRRAQTADLARRIRLEVADADPDVAVSLAASTMGQGPTAAGGYTRTRTYADVFQDWPAWLAGGVIDAAFPMNYFRERTHASWLDDWLAFEQTLVREGRVLAVGQASYLNPVEASLSQIARARAATDGVVLYSYAQDADEPPFGRLRAALARGAFAAPAPAPELRPTETLGHVLARAVDGESVRAAPAGGGTAVVVRADATGHAGFLHLAPGTWTVTADGFRPATVTVRAGQVTRAILERS